MSIECFQLIDNEAYDNSIIKRDFLNVYHQQAANLNDSDQNIDFIFGENSTYHQIGNAYLHYELTKEEGVSVAAYRVLVNGDVLVNNTFANCFKEARFSTTGGSDFENNKYVGQASNIIMRALTSKDGDLLSHFDKIDEPEEEIENTSLHHHLVKNHDQPAGRGKIKGVLPLEHFFWIL